MMMAGENVRYAELLPVEFRKRLAAKPIAYLPLGTLEWHGEHLPLGSDALISEGLMVQAAQRLGGIVLPPVHLGPDRSIQTADHGHLQGMDFVDESSSPGQQLPGSCYWIPESMFAVMLDFLLKQIERAGFKAVFADGHGPSRASWIRHIEDREARFDLSLLGVTGELKTDWKSQLDHAAKNETSLMMAIQPGLVDLSKLPADRGEWPVAVDGSDPRDSSAELGQSAIDHSIDALALAFDRAGF
jgi:creatinine amidohydrolase